MENASLYRIQLYVGLLNMAKPVRSKDHREGLKEERLMGRFKQEDLR